MNEHLKEIYVFGKAAATNEYDVDVLVIGGGPAGTWAAIRAAESGATTLLVDKGYCGTSGATAAAGTNIWHVPPHLRDKAKNNRFAMGGYLAEHGWMDRVLEQTWHNNEQLEAWGYPYPRDEQGTTHYVSLQGPEYMRLMRKRVKAAGAKILDQSPALALLVDADGTVSGAMGVRRQIGDTWAVRAGAVIIATGGCAFLSRALGCNVLTGDGYLLAAEAGAELSGMEFSNAYGLAPAFASTTKSLFYTWATFYDQHGHVIEGAGSSRGRGIIAQTLQTEPVFACLDRADDTVKSWMRQTQHNFFLPFQRRGIDPFTDHFPVALRLEGTVRGTGGLNLVDTTCATSVPGLYAAGDAATREFICGGFTGGGSHNAAWAMSSGSWAGAGAARHAMQNRGRRASALRSVRSTKVEQDDRATLSTPGLVRLVQQEVFPTQKNWWRSAVGLQTSLEVLDTAWQVTRHTGLPGYSAADWQKAREAAAMLATARWMYRSALARPESRGMARRSDHPALDPRQQHRLLSGGLDEVWTRPTATINADLTLAA